MVREGQTAAIATMPPKTAKPLKKLRLETSSFDSTTFFGMLGIPGEAAGEPTDGLEVEVPVEGVPVEGFPIVGLVIEEVAGGTLTIVGAPSTGFETVGVPTGLPIGVPIEGLETGVPIVGLPTGVPITGRDTAGFV